MMIWLCVIDTQLRYNETAWGLILSLLRIKQNPRIFDYCSNNNCKISEEQKSKKETMYSIILTETILHSTRFKTVLSFHNHGYLNLRQAPACVTQQYAML